MELLSEMLSLTEKFMIERWMSLRLFFRNCSLSLFKGEVKINCGGSLPKNELSRSKITSELYRGRKGEISHGRMCGGPLPQGLRGCVLCGR